MKKIIIILVTLLLASCGTETMEGDYVSKSSGDNPLSELMKVKLSFSEDSKVRLFMSGRQVGIIKYEKDGDEITLFKGDGTTQILTVEESGDLMGMGQEFVKLDK